MATKSTFSDDNTFSDDIRGAPVRNGGNVVGRLKLFGASSNKVD